MDVRKKIKCGVAILFCALALAACGEENEKQKDFNQDIEKEKEESDISQNPEETDEAQNTQEPVAETVEETEVVKIRFYNVEGVDNWGDCTYIEFPNGENMLIDTGLSGATMQIVEGLLDQGIDEIDHLVLTHGHADHVQGLSNVLGNMTVKHAYSSGYYATDFQWVLRDLEGRGVEHRKLTAGDSFQVGEVNFEVLWPLAEDVAESPENEADVITGPGSTEDLNNKSLVFLMNYGENKVLFTGDLYTAGEKDILEVYAGQPDAIKADVLKIMHHGYETSSSEAFIQAVSPKWAVAMGTRAMPGNIYSRYTDVGCTTYLSWMNGNVYVTLDGAEITVTPDNSQIADYYLNGTGSIQEEGVSTGEGGDGYEI